MFNEADFKNLSCLFWIFIGCVLVAGFGIGLLISKIFF